MALLYLFTVSLGSTFDRLFSVLFKYHYAYAASLVRACARLLCVFFTSSSSLLHTKGTSENGWLLHIVIFNLYSSPYELKDKCQWMVLCQGCLLLCLLSHLRCIQPVAMCQWWLLPIRLNSRGIVVVRLLPILGNLQSSFKTITSKLHLVHSF